MFSSLAPASEIRRNANDLIRACMCLSYAGHGVCSPPSRARVLVRWGLSLFSPARASPVFWKGRERFRLSFLLAWFSFLPSRTLPTSFIAYRLSAAGTYNTPRVCILCFCFCLVSSDDVPASFPSESFVAALAPPPSYFVPDRTNASETYSSAHRHCDLLALLSVPRRTQSPRLSSPSPPTGETYMHAPLCLPHGRPDGRAL